MGGWQVVGGGPSWGAEERARRKPEGQPCKERRKKKPACLGEQPAGLEGRGLGTRLRGGAKVREGRGEFLST